MKWENFYFDGKKKFVLKGFDTSGKKIMNDRKAAYEKGRENLLDMQSLQNRLYSEGKESLLIIFQAMDAAGKDGAIKHVMSGVNPQGVEVNNFKQPTYKDLSHDYIWRCACVLPERGKIGIFNRSYYEDVLIGKVHKLYESQKLPERCIDKHVIKRRYEEICNFEKYLWQNGTRIIKFFLNISKDEQKKRFLSRIEDKTKNWKLSESDIKERNLWDDYMKAYEKAINHTAAPHAPWYVVPADKKWFARYFVSNSIVNALREMHPHFPVFPKEKKNMLIKCKGYLLVEDEI